MTEKEMRKLSRADLLELLLQERKENESLRAEIESLKHQLDDHMLKIKKVGSIAEAALQVNGFFEAAQKAAYQYMENIRFLGDKYKKACEKMKADTEAKCRDMERRMEVRCEQSRASAKETASIPHRSDNDAT